MDQREMVATCFSYKDQLENIMCTRILSPQCIFLLMSLEHDLNVILEKLSLYQQELHYYCSYNQHSKPKCFCSLVILKQPFPKPIKHNTRTLNVETEDPVIVELITAPKASCVPVGKVKAQLMHEEISKRTSVEIVNSEQPMESDGVARFPNIRFPSGSRQKMVRLQFAVEVTYLQNQIVAGKQLLQSNLTHPFIIMTNENQWKFSEGGLLKKAAFGSNKVIPLTKFFNFLQIHYLKATRQNPVDPKRPLSLREIQYFSQLPWFLNKKSITLDDFQNFWNWFGEAMHKIRHHKLFSTMWLEGEIFGFIDKSEATKLVNGASSGTFIVRFSERRSGSVAIAYSLVDTGTGRFTVKHYLVKQSEFENFIDFLGRHTHFQWFLPTKTNFSCCINDCKGERVLKRDIIRKYTLPVEEVDVGGYDPLDDDTEQFYCQI